MRVPVPVVAIVLAFIAVTLFTAWQEPDAGSGWAGPRRDVFLAPEPVPDHGWAGPRPEDMVSFYVVLDDTNGKQAEVIPAAEHRRFIMTGFQSWWNGTTHLIDLLIDGQTVSKSLVAWQHAGSMVRFPMGIPVPSGKSLSVRSATSVTYVTVFGYYY